jgi:hypothetical protein
MRFIRFISYFESLHQFLRFNRKAKRCKLFGPIILSKYDGPQGADPPDLTCGTPDLGRAHVQAAQRERRSSRPWRPAAHMAQQNLSHRLGRPCRAAEVTAFPGGILLIPGAKNGEGDTKNTLRSSRLRVLLKILKKIIYVLSILYH